MMIARVAVCRPCRRCSFEILADKPGASSIAAAAAVFLFGTAASRRWSALSNSTAAITTTSCQPVAPPPRYGSSIRNHDFEQQRRYYQTDKSSSDDGVFDSLPPAKDRQDCPLCRKYSQGPCGEMFQQWLACTDNHPGYTDNNDKNEKLHLSKCRHLAEPLAACLERHKETYDAEQDIYSNEEELEYGNDWETILTDLESSQTAQSFPDDELPMLQLRPQTNTGMAGFDYEIENQKKKLVLCYVRDTDTGELLAAGSVDDLLEFQQRGVLRLFLSRDIESITAYAMYTTASTSSKDDDDDVLYKYTVKVPR